MGKKRKKKKTASNGKQSFSFEPAISISKSQKISADEIGRLVKEKKEQMFCSQEAGAREGLKISINEAHSEGMGFLHGKRQEQAERALEKIWEMIKSEKLAVTQVEYLMRGLDRKIREEEEIRKANTTIE